MLPPNGGGTPESPLRRRPGLRAAGRPSGARAARRLGHRVDRRHLAHREPRRDPPRPRRRPGLVGAALRIAQSARPASCRPSSSGVDSRAGRPAVRARRRCAAVAARCSVGAPAGAFTVVVRAGPTARRRSSPTPRSSTTGRPMPTRYWLVDAGACGRRSAGSSRPVGCAGPRPRSIPARWRRPTRATRAERDALVPDGPPRSPPLGWRRGHPPGVKCLHAHLAWWLAGGEDPVGRLGGRQLGSTRPTP